MARTKRSEVFAADEIAVVHVMNRVVRRCFLMGEDPVSGKNFDHRKRWIEAELVRSAASFGIDLIAFSLLCNHMHMVLRSRPDVVETWTDAEVARRWLMLCPVRKDKSGHAAEPSECELNSIRLNPERLNEIRRRLSDISWWMRLLCQRIAQRANREDGVEGHFWQSRFRGVRLIDEQAILAAAVYVDLNPIRAALAETIEESDFTSAQRRIRSLSQEAKSPIGKISSTTPSTSLVATRESPEGKGRSPKTPSETEPSRSDRCLAPVEIDELRDSLGAMPSRSRDRCSDKGFTSMTSSEYVELLDWTARQIVKGKRGATPATAPSVLQRLGMEPTAWCELSKSFGILFSLVAGQPQHVDAFRSRLRRSRFYLPAATRELLTI
ncbi:hypothetical protein [Aureliella helgolandensis]|uniref:Transposase IS200-like domain-containing protein n=1 Tax=Aureliella helgolandensis TaxID=2527968 RepID=A0A518GDB1_9BACT|nr:hypothetical protein [Aureliella helgolandensis]QDV26582.1 hypothetical protein Q31a_49560 [Aureliella helgolandensis]